MEAESYAPVSDEACKRNVEAAKKVRLVVVCDMPIGHGNLRNLEAASSAQDRSVPVVLLRNGLPPWAEERDYTGGEATRALEQLAGWGARRVESIDEVVITLDESVSEAAIPAEDD